MVLIECEQKFIWTSNSFNILTQLCKSPSNSSHALVSSPLKTFTIRDTYYDSHRRLSNNGLWVRKRAIGPEAQFHKWHHGEEYWQAKQSQALEHDPLRTSFEEADELDAANALPGNDSVREKILRHIPTAGYSNENYGLHPICSFVTLRHSFVAGGIFNAVLDETNFGHRVGEVELMAKDADAEDVHAEIDKFMAKHPWFFLRPRNVEVKGKLTAYFEKFGYPEDADDEKTELD